VAFGNIDGFPVNPHNNPKVQVLCAFQAQYDIDVFGGCKSNINWKQMPYSGRLYEWFRSPNPLWAIAGHNTHDNFGCKQFGGTFLLGNGEITTSISASGTDPSGLGRWAWFSLLGHTGITTRIISAYRLSNSSLSQTSSVRSQQCSYLLSQGDTYPPHDAFLRDLGLAIAEWQAIGDQIILMADMNGDIWKPEISSFCTNLGLHKAILSAHPTLLPPVTFK